MLDPFVMSSKSDTHKLKPHHQIYGLSPWIKKNVIISADLSSSYGVCSTIVRSTVTWCLSLTAVFKVLGSQSFKCGAILLESESLYKRKNKMENWK